MPWERVERLDTVAMTRAVQASTGMRRRRVLPARPLREFSSRSAALERWVRGIGSAYLDELTGEILDSFPAKLLLPAWAHMSLRMVDWAIRHFTPADVDLWLDLAKQRAGAR